MLQDLLSRLCLAHSDWQAAVPAETPRRRRIQPPSRSGITEEDNGAQGKAWAKAMEIFEEETGVKVEFEKKSFEQIRQNASQILNSDEAPDVMEYNKGNATAGLRQARGC